jgi:transposase
MLTRMTEQDWAVVLKIFRAACSQQGDKGRDDRKFLEALHYFTVYNITWRALPSEFGRWNSVWKRFWRLSRSGVFEARSVRDQYALPGTAQCQRYFHPS